MASTNQRKAQRTPVTLKIKFKSETLDQFIERYSVDISQGGIFIRTKDPLPVGTTLRFEFQLKDASPLITGEGIVVWTRDRESSSPGVAPGMGVRFDKLPGESHEVLRKILAQKAPQMAGPRTASAEAGGEFGDTPTRVAPEGLSSGLALGPLSSNAKPAPKRTQMGMGPIRGPEDDRTPLPKPMPFQSDADDFAEEAFEEATKIANYDSQDLAAARGDGDGDGDGPDDVWDRPTGELSRDEISAVVAKAEAGESDGGAGEDEPAEVAPGEAAGETGEAAGETGEAAGEAAAEATADDSADAEDDDAIREVRDELAERRARRHQSGDSSAAGDADGDSRAGSEAEAAGEAQGGDPAWVSSDSGRAEALPAQEADEPETRVGKGAWLLAVAAIALLAGGGYYAMNLRGDASAATEPADETPDQAAPATTPPPEPEPAPEPAAATVALSVETAPEGATVEIVGEDESADSPATFEGLEADVEYTLRVTHPEYKPREITATPGTEPVTVELEPLPRFLAITSSPAGAAVEVNGERKGATPAEVPIEGALATADRYQIRLRRRGYRPATEEVAAEGAFAPDGERLVHELEVELSRRPRRRQPSRSQADNKDESSAGDSADASGDGEPDDSASGGTKTASADDSAGGDDSKAGGSAATADEGDTGDGPDGSGASSGDSGGASSDDGAGGGASSDDGASGGASSSGGDGESTGGDSSSASDGAGGSEPKPDWMDEV